MDAKKKSIGAILAISIFATSCANHNNEVTVTIRGEEAKKTEKPTVETKEEVTWVQYDETALMYKVDLDRFLKDKLKLSRRTLQNEDVVNVLNLIREELGEDLYTKDKEGNKFCNLEGKSVVISAYDSRFLYFNFKENYDAENSLVYNIHVDNNGKTHVISREREEKYPKVSKYYIIYNGSQEVYRTIHLRESSTESLSIGLHVTGTFKESYSICFSTEMGEAEVDLSKEEYEVLFELIKSYSESDNLYEFLSDNIDLLNKYLDLIRVKNAEYYEHLCGLINKYIEQAKVLRYE